MKKLLLILLSLILCASSLFSCNYTENSSSSKPSQEPSSEVPSSSEESSSTQAPSSSEVPEPSPIPDKQGSIETKYTQKYYKEISSGYSRTTFVENLDPNQENHIFIDGIFEPSKKSQYKIISSFGELQEFSLLNRGEVSADLFNQNYVVAILHYSLGSSIDAIRHSGLHSANFSNNNKAKITADFFHAGGDSTDDLCNVYELYFIVLPRAELKYSDQVLDIDICVSILNQCDTWAYDIDETTDTTKAYLLRDKSAEQSWELFGSVSNRLRPNAPSIAIHLDEPIKTDYIVNRLDYEDGKIFVTIQIFDKTEMNDWREENENLIIISLSPHYAGLEINIPETIPNGCTLNIIFENVATVN